MVSQRDTFEIGETYNLLWSFMPEGSGHEVIKFESSDPTIVSVDQNGKMTMLDEGTTTITGVTDSGLTDSVEIHVKRPKAKELIMINPRNNSVDIRIGSTYQFMWSFEPEKSLWPEIKWESEDETIATVSETGLVNGLKEGKVTIIGKYEINDIVTSSFINVNVLPERGFGEYVNFVDRLVKVNTTLQFRHPLKTDHFEYMNVDVGFLCWPFLDPILETDINTIDIIKTITNVEGDSVIRTVTFNYPDLYRIEVDIQNNGQMVCYVLATDAELPETLTLEVGDTYALLPPKSLNVAGLRYALSLNSSVQSILYVNNESFYYGGDGNITALKPGVVTVTLYGDIMSSKEPIDTCVVTIKEKTVETEIIPEEEKKEEATKPDTKPDTRPDPNPDPTPTPKPEVKVEEILGVPEYVIFGKEIVLDDTVKVSPYNATYKNIEWSLVDENQPYLELRKEDGKTIIKGKSDSSSGVKLQAKITNGLLNEDFTQEFVINVLYDITNSLLNQEIKIKQNEMLDMKIIEAINGAGSPYKFEFAKESTLPEGIQLVNDKNDDSVAKLTGSISKAGEYPFIITVTDKDGNTKDFDFKLIVEAEENKELDVTLTPDSLGDAKINETYNVTLNASEHKGALTFNKQDGELPDGFGLKNNGNHTASLEGTPTIAGTYEFTIRVSDEFKRGKHNFLNEWFKI